MSAMSLKEFFFLLGWDWRINRGWSFDRLRSMLLLFEIRYEQFIFRNFYRPRNPLALLWYLTRFLGSIFQWMLANSIIPGDVRIGRGLRFVHPQNIIVARYAQIGEFCTLYQNVSIVLNGFQPNKPPSIGNKVMLGTGCSVVGDVTVGSNVIIGVGAVVLRSVPDQARVLSPRPTVITNYPSRDPAEPGSERHIEDPYSLWH